MEWDVMNWRWKISWLRIQRILHTSYVSFYTNMRKKLPSENFIDLFGLSIFISLFEISCIGFILNFWALRVVSQYTVGSCINVVFWTLGFNDNTDVYFFLSKFFVWYLLYLTFQFMDINPLRTVLIWHQVTFPRSTYLILQPSWTSYWVSWIYFSFSQLICFLLL